MIYLQLTNYLFKTNYKCKVLNDGLKKKVMLLMIQIKINNCL